ncbi:TAM domain methyltransferase [Histoplasma capsulatum]|uniref:TAM domain methyltransferase n=1 Tax=Ajellomyces capsulatus TaxID=5037 RepID=A0A8A1M356_AJECA|nr:TAM domain methyltransferase [Histoplasma capsulatum]
MGAREWPLQSPTASLDRNLDGQERKTLNSVWHHDIHNAIFTAVLQNGRRYHGLKDGSYFLLHFIYRCVLSRRLYCAPIDPNPRRVLDLGTGTGNWAIEFADQHQKSQVLGTDLSPIQRISIPLNCTFEIDDFEAEWPYIVAATDDTHAPKPPSPRADNRIDDIHNNDNLTTSVPTQATSPILFDFIHTREITGSVHNYSKLFERAYRHVAPGGYLEMQSMEANFFSDDGTHERAVTAMQWQRLLVEASRRFGKELGVEGGWKEGMEQAGFVDVEEVVFKVPLSPWPKDARMKDLGRYQATHVQEMLQSYSLALFTRVLEWSKEELDVLLRAVGNDLKDMRSHLYTKVRVVYGRKRE